MTITLELPDDLAQRLVADAEAREDRASEDYRRAACHGAVTFWKTIG